MVSAARNGLGGALLLDGEPGIGKTALLEAATAERAGVRLLRADGFEAESTLPYAALQRLMIPLRDHLPSLPERHQQALRVAAGVGRRPAAGPVPGRAWASWACSPPRVRTPRSSARSTTPTSSTPSRSTRSPSSLAGSGPSRRPWCCASREVAHVGAQMAGVPRLRVAGLAQEAAVGLLLSSLPEPIDPAAAAQIAVATGGNPLALIDLAGELSVKRLTEAGLADEPIPVGPRLEAYYLRRVRLLCRRRAAVAAGGGRGLHREPRPDPGHRQGRSACPPRPGTRPRRPGSSSSPSPSGSGTRSVRSAVYGAAPGGERRRVHAALAAAAADLGRVELEAWHAAKATLGTDAAVADRLERVADLAGRRGAGSPRGRACWRRPRR